LEGIPLSRLLVAFTLSLILFECADRQEYDNSIFNFSDFTIAIGGKEDFSEQTVTYFITLDIKEGISIEEDSIELALADWVRGTNTISEIVKKSIDKNNIKIEARVTYKSGAPANIDHEQMKDSIKGILFMTEHGEKFKVIRGSSSLEPKIVKIH
jgi:hypothetical protein